MEYYIDGSLTECATQSGTEYMQWRVMMDTEEGPTMITTFYGPSSLVAATVFCQALNEKGWEKMPGPVDANEFIR